MRAMKKLYCYVSLLHIMLQATGPTSDGRFKLCHFIFSRPVTLHDAKELRSAMGHHRCTCVVQLISVQIPNNCRGIEETKLVNIEIHIVTC